jgi:hypothetical protein
LAVGRFDHRVFADGEPHALAGFEDVVAEVVVARQPDAAIDHGEFAAETAEMCRVARVHLKRPAMECLELRIHHQSPALGVAIIGLVACVIQ